MSLVVLILVLFVFIFIRRLAFFIVVFIVVRVLV
jgi:hypothetical protein